MRGTLRVEERVQIAIGKQVNRDKLPRLPVAGDLQYRRAGEAAMGKEQIFAEHRPVFGGNNGRNGDPGERLELFQQRFMQRKRHQTGAGRQHLQAKLLGNFVTERRGTQPRHRQTAAGNHQVIGTDGVTVELKRIALFVTRDRQHLRAQAHDHAALFALGHQHIDNLLRGVVAEQLAQRLLMPGDAVLTHQIDKVPLGVTRQCRFTKMPVLAQIRRRFNIEVGKVAAPAAGHQDFTAWLFTVIQQQYATTRLSGHRRTKHTRRTGANYHGIKPFHVKILIIHCRGL